MTTGGPPPLPAPFDPGRRRFLVLGGTAALAAAVAATGCSPFGGDESSTTVSVTEPIRPIPPSMPGAEPPPPAGFVFDTVIKGGRVIDPDSGFDTIADVGITGDRITSISLEPLQGTTTLDATGKVVAPGFVDLLSYEPNSFGTWYKIGDGVTTNLGMHGIKAPTDAGQFFAQYGGTSPVHFGGAFSDQWFRETIGIYDTASASQLSRLRDALDQQIDAGFIGVAIDPEYAPYIDFAEYVALGEVARDAGVPLFTHIRYSSPDPPEANSISAIEEVIRVAEQSGVSLHVDHIPSMATHVMSEAMSLLDDARGQGLDVTGCFYPYTYWGTYLGSARFNGDWQSRFRITYEDLQVAGTSERVTAQTFGTYQAQNKLVVAYAMPQADINAAASASWTMVGSDSIPEPADNNHPRGAGCFARLVGPYVRELGVLSLNDAIAKATIIPTKRVEKVVPLMQRKGRLQMGADADITVFDPATVADRSTVEDPSIMSAGIEQVLVMGGLVKNGDQLDTSLLNGQGIKGEPL
ncbi:amidohydrolase family protein [Rhabdothermincola salaria]|uniref:amidohydrolase family protein n=1 Tax=Rhabdothermincola salaria TaxID=2903142 RepID=UPI001E293E29|nr:amidohydrolase family protein [Rhabdothermincola salaria]